MTLTLALITLITIAYTAAAAAGKPRPENGIWNRDVAPAHRAHISPARERVVRMLNAGLAGTPMAGTGRQLEAAGWKWHVHPAFMAGVAGIEAAWGRLACHSNRFNAFGLGSCGDSWTPPAFRSWAHAYDYYARFLRDRWPHARSPYDFHGYCVDRYGNDCPSWARNVAWNMNRLGFPPAVNYGRS